MVNCQQANVYTGYGAACMIPAYSSEGILRATAISYNEMFKDNAVIMVWNLEDNEQLWTTEESIGEDAIVEFLKRFAVSARIWRGWHQNLALWETAHAEIRLSANLISEFGRVFIRWKDIGG